MTNGSAPAIKISSMPETILNEAQVLVEESRNWLDWFLGTPLKIFLIALISTIALLVANRAIRLITEKIASGVIGAGSQKSGSNRKGRISEVNNLLLKASPLTQARRAQRARTLSSVLRSTLTIVVGAIAVLMILDVLGINIMPLVASAGVVGVALGFGAQSLVKDFISGTFMLFEDQYGVGDVVNFGDVSGTIEAVALRVTKVRDEYGTLWYLRNGEILSVGNMTQGWARASVEIQLNTDQDLALAREKLGGIAKQLSLDPQIKPLLIGEPEVHGIETLSAQSVSFKIQAKTQPAKQWEVSRKIRELIMDQLVTTAGIKLGFRDQNMILWDGKATLSPEPENNIETTPLTTEE